MGLTASTNACRESGGHTMRHTAAQPSVQLCREGGAAGCGGDSDAAAQLRADGAERQALMQVAQLHALATSLKRQAIPLPSCEPLMLVVKLPSLATSPEATGTSVAFVQLLRLQLLVP
jgi:hypothetical protein